MNVEKKDIAYFVFSCKTYSNNLCILTTSKNYFYSVVYSEFIETKSRILISSIYQISANLKQKKIIGLLVSARILISVHP